MENSHFHATASTEQFRNAYEAIVIEILQKHQWKLVKDLNQFIEEVWEETQLRLGRGTAHPIQFVVGQSTLNRYSHLWVTICLGEENLAQMEAYIELNQYVYHSIQQCCYRYQRDILQNLEFLEDCTQHAVERIWHYLPSITDPGAFLHIIRLLTHQTVRQSLSTIQKTDDPLEPSLIASPTTSQWQVGPGEIRKALQQCLRSTTRIHIIIATFIQQRTVNEISSELGITPQAVSQHKAKALKQLRHCRPLLDLLRQ